MSSRFYNMESFDVHKFGFEHYVRFLSLKVSMSMCDWIRGWEYPFLCDSLFPKLMTMMLKMICGELEE
jgi:hypothetical protein